MSHLVDDEIRDIGLVVARHEGEQGIGHPAQGREGVDRPRDDVVPELLHAPGLGLGFLRVEVTAIGQIAHHGVGPEVAVEGKLGAGLDDGGEAVGVEDHDARVVLRFLEPEFGYREGTRGLGALEECLGRRGRTRVGEGLRHGQGPSTQLEIARALLDLVTGA